MSFRLRGLRVSKQIVCDLCHNRFPHGGLLVKDGPKPGLYCSADHAMKAVDEVEEAEIVDGGDVNAVR